MERKATPIIKWAGGKRQIISELLARVPDEFDTYLEFFLGGGALFFELYNQGRISRAVLSDLNPKLINLYSIVKSRPFELIEELKDGKYANNEASFYELRAWEPDDSVEQAARFLYLNKTAFNGLYRENSSGKFNVPFGRYANPKILDAEGILSASNALSKAKLVCGDFEKILDYAKKGDFAYFDPPYHPLNATSSFTAYTSKDFSSADQMRLRQTFEILENRGVKLLLSNSSAEFVESLYSDYEVSTVMASRMINCNAEKRGAVRELLVVG